MEEEKKVETTETTENKVIVAYTVKRYENGDIDIQNTDDEGTTKLANEALYKDVEDVADMIKYKRTENAAYRGILRFYQEAARSEQQKAATAETVESPEV